MTTQADFTDAEWTTIRRALTMIPAAIFRVSLGGIVPEVMTLAGVYMSATMLFTTDLSQGLLKTVDNSASPPHSNARRRYQPPETETFVGETWHALQQATQIVERVATLDEAGEYKSLLLYLAEQLALAGKEGDALGLTGGRLNDAERELMHQIADAVGLEWHERETDA
jgi:hypothetical protein